MKRVKRGIQIYHSKQLHREYQKFATINSQTKNSYVTEQETGERERERFPFPAYLSG
eukprot:c55461_g1_i1 orf=1-168(-)